MLTFFRKLLYSRLGVIFAFLVLGVIFIAFALGDATGLGKGTFNASTGSSLVTVGKQSVSAAEVKKAFEQLRQQYPQVPIAELIAKGGFDQPLDTRINEVALEEFGKSQGMRIGDDLVGSEISSIPDFKGIDGKFDKKLYRQILDQQRLTDADVKSQIARNLMARLLFGPLGPQSLGRTPAPVNMATPYASMLLEKRSGTVAFIETSRLPAGAPVTDAEAGDYYRKNIGRYTVPERRSIRYAEITMDDLKARSVPTDAEIAKAYQDQRAKFEPSENRTLSQVVLADQKSAEALAAKVRGGTAIDAAAKAVGLAAGTSTDIAKAAYAGQTSAALADQAFGAASGAVVGPIKTPIGWTVAHVDKITKVPGKTLDQARPELIKAVTDQKVLTLGATLRQQIGDAIANKATLDQVASQFKLTLQTTAALDAQGNDPDAKAPLPAKPDVKLQALSSLGFQSEVEDDPQLLQVAQDGSFAVAKLDKIVPATPRPLTTVMDQVKKEFLLERQLREARAIAQTVIGKVNKGMPLAQALAETKLTLQPVQRISANRGQVLTSKTPSTPLIVLFTMPVHTAKLLPAPNKAGWFVAVSDSIEPGDARAKPDVVNKMRGDLTATTADEYSQQFIRAIRNTVGVKRNDAAINGLRTELLGQGSTDGQ